VNSREVVQAYIKLFNARRAVDGEPPISRAEMPLYEKVLSTAPKHIFDVSGWEAEEYAKKEVGKIKK
jgi:hypothetical protein